MEQPTHVSAAFRTDVLFDFNRRLTPQRAVVDASDVGDNTVLAAVTGRRLRVVELFLVASADVVAYFRDGTAGDSLTGPIYMAERGGLVLPFSPVGWFETSGSTLLSLNLSTPSVGGAVTYLEVAG